MNHSSERELSHFVWRTRYRHPSAHPPDVTIEDTWKRVAGAVAAIEKNPALWGEQFLSAPPAARTT